MDVAQHIMTVILAVILLFLLASINGTLALIYLVSLFSVLLFRRTYLGWYQNIVRMIRSRNQFNQHSAKQPVPDVGDVGKDNDLTLELALSSEEMRTGTQRRVPTEDGAIDVEVPAGISPGKRLRIRGKGKFDRDTSKRGDLYLEIVARINSSC
jgi:curved DNA-binding protein CbpA